MLSIRASWTLRWSRGSLFALWAFSACAGPELAVTPSAPQNLVPPSPAPTQLPPAHGHGRMHFALRDGKTGVEVSTEQLNDRLAAARAVYVGEQHNSRASHLSQLYVLGRTYAVDHDVALGIEMLPRRLQPQIDAFLGGSIDEDGFLDAVDWPHTWGFSYDLYRPLFEFCRTHGLRIYALNAPRELPRAVRLRGIEGLTPAERELLPSGYPWPAPELHRQFLREIFDSHPGSTGAKPDPAAAAAREEAFGRFYAAQLIWDESMAQAVTEILSSTRPPKRLLVLAGTGHVGPLAMPGRAARRGVSGTLTFGPIDKPSDPLPTGAEAVDVVIVLDEPEQK